MPEYNSLIELQVFNQHEQEEQETTVVNLMLALVIPVYMPDEYSGLLDKPQLPVRAHHMI